MRKSYRLIVYKIVSGRMRIRRHPDRGMDSKYPALIVSSSVDSADLTEAEAIASAPGLPPMVFKMSCDVAELTGDGNLAVTGWAVCEAGIAQVRVFLNELEVGLASYGHDRSDVGARFPAIRMAHLSGFQFERQIGQSVEGEHAIRIVVRNNQDEEAVQTDRNHCDNDRDRGTAGA